MSIAYLLTGSNLGDRAGNLQAAISFIQQRAGKLVQCSPVYESSSWGFEHPTPFLNQALKLETEHKPDALLKILLEIETLQGRLRNSLSNDYEARTIDIDILFYNEEIIGTADLSIPHPKLHLRRFVLKPLTAIAPLFVHPILGRDIEALLKACPDDSLVKEYSDCCSFCRKEIGDAL